LEQEEVPVWHTGIYRLGTDQFNMFFIIIIGSTALRGSWPSSEASAN
jgi:hypothetical protein